MSRTGVLLLFLKNELNFLCQIRGILSQRAVKGKTY